MTWRELYNFLAGLSDEELDTDVTVGVVHDGEWLNLEDPANLEEFDSKAEYYGCSNHGVMRGSDVIDDGTPFIGIIT